MKKPFGFVTLTVKYARLVKQQGIAITIMSSSGETPRVVRTRRTRKDSGRLRTHRRTHRDS